MPFFRILLLLPMVVAGCGERVDRDALFDDEVAMYFNGRASRDAIAFLEEGGRYIDADIEDDEPRIDEPYVLPLVRQLRDEHGLAPIAILDPEDPRVAVAIVAESGDAAVKAAVNGTIAKADRAYPGEILSQWGHRWLSVDFLTPEEAEFFREEGP